KATMRSLLDNEPVVTRERMLRRKDGSSVPIEINPSLVRDAVQQPLYIQTVFRDLTERRRAERQSIELEMERERINLLQEFVTGIAHDLRTPLANVKNSEYLLRRVGQHSPEKFDQYLNVIRDEINKLTRLVDNQVAAVRETIPSRPSDEGLPVDVNEIVRMVVATSRNRMGEREVRLNLEEETMPPIPGDVDRLRMAIRQVVINAIHFTKEEGKIAVTTRAGEHYVQVSIEDDGVGISEKDLPFIFDSLYRADRSRHESSSGLGLTIAHQIVTAHGGTIEVESEPGNGSRFIIHLPVRNQVAPEDKTRPAR
ncbi:MAG: PAS domain-containing sensor histidine kinase, partial [Chloroflexota bacterium]